jgi:hypothetical protein
LKEPQYAEGLRGPLELPDDIQKHTDFVFKGRIEKISEIEVSWQTVTSLGDNIVQNDWLTSCDVTIENILNGEAPDAKEMIKVVFMHSSRSQWKDNAELIEGQEYYFITGFYTEEYRANTRDRIKPYRFGDVKCGSRFFLMPVNDGIVTFNRQWPFTGSKQVEVTAEKEYSFESVAATIDEKSFVEQLLAMIQAAKATPAPQVTASAMD